MILLVFSEVFDIVPRRIMKRFLENNFLILVSIIIILYALFLNIFFPKKNENFKKESTFGETKNSFKDAILEYIPEDVAGLGVGYLLGEKSELPDGLETKMKAVGMAHIIVVSGTHLSIIIMSARKIFEKISRILAFCFSIALLIFYILLVGVSPSLIRASFVAILSLVAWYFGREKDPFRMILYTLGGCFLINPYLLTNLSFQLSMCAYMGIIVIFPLLTLYFYGRDRPKMIGSTILSSLAATIACLPIQIYYFGTINLAFLASNLLILPTISLAMGLSFLTGLCGMIGFSGMGTGFGYLAGMVLKYHISVVSALYDKSEFLIEIPKKNWLVLIAYLLLFLLLLYILKKKKRERNIKKQRWQKLSRMDIWRD